MRVAVLGSLESWHGRELVRAAAGRCELVSSGLEALTSSVANDSIAVHANGVDLMKCDAVLVRAVPLGSLEQAVFRMDALAQLEAGGVVVVNPPKAIEAAVDKYLTTARLARAGLPVPRTVVSQTVDQALAAFRELGGDVVVKPLFGSGGRGMARLADESLAHRAFRLLADSGAVMYVQEFLQHEGYDDRLLVIGDQVLGISRHSAVDWRTNIRRGAEARPLEVTNELARLAREAAVAVGAPLAGVDILPARHGRLYVVEVNSVPGWRAVQETLQIDVATLVIDLVESLVANRRNRRENEALHTVSIS